MNRRNFVGLSLRTAAAAGLAPLVQGGFGSSLQAQASGDYRAIVCLFLAGGLDANNLLIPCDSRYSEYAASRGQLAIAQGKLNTLNPSVSGQAFGLNPAMPNMAALFNRKEAAFLANVGTLPYSVTKATASNASLLPINMYSHSAQSSEWATAVTQNSATTGWAGRIADNNPESTMPMVVSTAGYSLMGQGKHAKPGTASDGTAAVTGLNTLATLTHYMSSAEASITNDHITAYVSDFQANFLSQTKTISDAFVAGSGLKTSFPGSSIGQQLQAVTQMINGRRTHDTKRQIFICVDGGYDTHSNQFAQESNYFARLDAAISSFVQGLHEIGMYESVSLFSGSDFGRTLRPNATNGSDHAWGSHHFIVGGNVRGGEIYGKFPSMIIGGQDDLNGIGTWVPTTSTTQYLSTMSGWLGLDETALNNVFPERQNFTQGRLQFL